MDRELAGPEEPRVALCAAGEIWGGVEQFIETLSRELQRRRVGFVVLLHHDGLLARHLRDAGVPLEVIPGAGKYDPTTVIRIKRTLSLRGVHVVHVHGYKATVIAGIAAKLAHLPVVKTEHGRLEPFTGWAQLKMKMNMWLDHRLSQWLMSTIVYVSKDIQRSLSGRFGRIPQTVIYNAIHPIQTEDVRERPTPLEPKNAFRVGIIGRLKPIKGHEVLIRAIGRLPRDTDTHLYVFGEGPTEEALRAQCREAGLEDRVHFMGFRERVRVSMRELDVLAMPSFHEGIPYTALEAMSLGLPVVASDVGGLHEILENEVDALLLPPGDPDALASALERLARDPALRRRLAGNARSKLEARFLAPAMADRYLEVYREAIARS